MTDLIKNTMFVGQQLIIGLTLTGIMIYALSLLYYLYLNLSIKDEDIRNKNPVIVFFEAPPPVYMFGLPIAATIAFAIVSILFPLTPMMASKEGAPVVTFNAFNMQFSGPAAPVTIWVVVYLSIVGSMNLVRGMADGKTKPKLTDEPPAGKLEQETEAR